MLTLSMSMAGQALHKLQNWEIMVEVWVEVVTVVELARPGSHWSQLWWILLAAAAGRLVGPVGGIEAPMGPTVDPRGCHCCQTAAAMVRCSTQTRSHIFFPILEPHQ